jgi:hypothetical protein
MKRRSADIKRHFKLIVLAYVSERAGPIQLDGTVEIAKQDVKWQEKKIDGISEKVSP